MHFRGVSYAARQVSEPGQPGIALRGLRVLEIASGIAGSYAGRLFADAGADVVKIEPAGGSPLRRSSSSAGPPPGSAALHRFLDASKRSLSGDLDRWADRRALLALAATADLIIEDGTAPGGLPAGLDPREIASRNPRACLVTLSPFGGAGPWCDRPASELTLQALCGSASARGHPGGAPIAAGGRLGEWLGGAYTALAGLAAHLATRRGACGQHVDVSLLDVMHLTMAPPQALQEQILGEPLAFPRSVETPSIHRARDGWVGFCTITAEQWLDFLVLIERADLRDDTALAHRDGRATRAEEIDAVVSAWTRRYSVAEILERADVLRVPAAPVGNGATVMELDHFRERGVFVEDPSGAFLRPRAPYAMSASAPAPLAVPEEAGASGRLGRIDPEGLWRRPPLATVSAAAPAGAPLRGLRVIDFTAFWAGPFVTRFFAALGADVVKIESVRHPDGMRFSATRAPSTPRWWETGGFFHAFNAGKRSVTLDLRSERGLALVRDLLRDADVAIENFSPRVFDGFGLRFQDLAADNPRLVLVRMPAFGLDGPWRDRVGFAQTMEQLSGLAWVTGPADGPPRVPRGPCDPLAGMHAGFATLAALAQRESSGLGQHVEAPMVEAALNAAVEQVLEVQVRGVLPTRAGNRGHGGVPQGIYAARGDDRWVALTVRTDAHWQSLVAVLGRPDWASAAELASGSGRRAAADEIDVRLGRWFAGRDRDEAVALLLARGVPAAPVLSQPEAANLDPLAARRLYESLRHEVVGEARVPGLAARFSAMPPGWPGRPAPTLGQHNGEVLGGELGMGEAELCALARAGVIGDELLAG